MLTELYYASPTILFYHAEYPTTICKAELSFGTSKYKSCQDKTHSFYVLVQVGMYLHSTTSTWNVDSKTKR